MIQNWAEKIVRFSLQKVAGGLVMSQCPGNIKNLSLRHYHVNLVVRAAPISVAAKVIYKGVLSTGLVQLRECVSMGAMGAQTRRSLGHHLLHPLILRPLVICAPLILRPSALFCRTDCTHRSRFLMQALRLQLDLLSRSVRQI